jgi:pimeloyl-ACP methyl ester carboxylesterase
MGSPGAWEPPGPALRLCFLLLWHDALVTDFVRWRWPFLYEHMFQRQTPMTEAVFHYQMAARANGEYFAPEGRAMSRCLRSIFDNSCRDRLSEIRCPVLLVWGEHDEIHPRASAVYFRQHLSDSRLVIIPDSGHEAMIDQPEEFNRVVLSFLDGGTAAVTDTPAISAGSQ